MLALLLTFVMHLVLGVPYVPTPSRAVEEMIGMVPWRGKETVLDLGAGDARILIAAKKRYPRIRAIGCEIVPTVWLLGMLRCFIARANVSLHLCSVFDEDLHEADVIFLYLMPGLLKRLLPKFQRELRPGTLIVCRTFALPGIRPIRVQKVRGFGGETNLFLYRWTKKSRATSAA